jgi:hypothetical protein
MKLNSDVLLSTSAFKFNLRRYNKGKKFVVDHHHTLVALELSG